MGVVWLFSHVLQLLPIRFIQRNSCCISKSHGVGAGHSLVVSRNTWEYNAPLCQKKSFQVTSFLTYMYTYTHTHTHIYVYIFEIGVKERESSLVIIPNHKPLKGSLLSWPNLTIKHCWIEGIQIVGVVNGTSANEEKPICSSWGSQIEGSRVLVGIWRAIEGHCGWQQVNMWATNMCTTWVGSRRAATYQSNLNLRLLSKPLAQLSVIELKVFQGCPMWFLLWCGGEL